MRRRRGFIFLMALSILAMLGALIWSLTAWTNIQVRASAEEAGQAQLRQLVLAGLQVAPATLRTGQQQQTIALPEGAREMALQVTVLKHGSAQAVVRIDARCEAHSASEQARYILADGHWVLDRMIEASDQDAAAEARSGVPK